MDGGQWERVARLEQRLDDLRREFDSHMEAAAKRSDRVQELSAAVGLLVEAQKIARRQEASQYRRLEVSMQRIAVSVSLGGLLVAIAMLVVALVLH